MTLRILGLLATGAIVAALGFVPAKAADTTVAAQFRKAVPQGVDAFMSAILDTSADNVEIRHNPASPKDPQTVSKMQLVGGWQAEDQSIHKGLTDFHETIKVASVKGGKIEVADTRHGNLSDGAAFHDTRKFLLTVKDDKIVALLVTPDKSDAAKKGIAALRSAAK
jgi:hypothetical protein